MVNLGEAEYRQLDPAEATVSAVYAFSADIWCSVEWCCGCCRSVVHVLYDRCVPSLCLCLSCPFRLPLMTPLHLPVFLCQPIYLPPTCIFLLSTRCATSRQGREALDMQTSTAWRCAACLLCCACTAFTCAFGIAAVRCSCDL